MSDIVGSCTHVYSCFAAQTVLRPKWTHAVKALSATRPRQTTTAVSLFERCCTNYSARTSLDFNFKILVRCMGIGLQHYCSDRPSSFAVQETSEVLWVVLNAGTFKGNDGNQPQWLVLLRSIVYYCTATFVYTKRSVSNSHPPVCREVK